MLPDASDFVFLLLHTVRKETHTLCAMQLLGVSILPILPLASDDKTLQTAEKSVTFPWDN